MRQTASIFGDPGRIAPSVDKVWRDDFIVELRLLSVPGRQIGDALMTVETHVAESGETAEDAFGQARDYAREIAAASGAAGRGWTAGPATVTGNVLGLLGMLVTMRAFSGWLEGGPVGITTGELVGLGLLLLLAGGVVFTRSLRVVVEHPWLVLLFPALLIGALVAIFALFTEPFLTVPTLSVGVAGVLVLGVSTAVGWFDGPEDMDQITAPGQAPRGLARARLVSALAMPLMTVLLLLFTWLLHVLT